jgi:hypothetical protein
MVVDIVVYSLILPSSVFGVMHEEKMLPVGTAIRAEDSGRLAKLPGTKRPDAQKTHETDGLNQRGRLERTP